MPVPVPVPDRSSRVIRATPLAALALAAALATVPSAAHAALGTPVPLGAASTFVVLAGAGVTNTGVTTLGGDIGSFATTSITGLGTITLVDGVNHGGDAVTQQAKTDLVTAYGSASSQQPDLLGGVELGGVTLEPGVYDTGGVIELNGELTLDGNGDPEAVFIFRSLSTLLAGAASSITFVDGATACNVYWRVPTSATIEAGSRFAGTILAEATISFGAGATLEGRALAQTGQVTLINNVITLPGCAAVVPPSPEPAPAPGDTPPTGTAVPPGTPDGATSTAPGPQVTATPRGGVATGDGSSTTPARVETSALVAVTMSGLGLVAWIAARTRRPCHLDT
ncbi:ice-binding family protein [Actinotalea sp. K2]|uniref:ice-binding family protein n=1 Tax=Actinotalea sp. K2 TaxID=2939438 RepID=UPI00201755BE|nr:ice-binding family protein [Actinotalea sp. K2]MCL3860626.1 ice-binding family protein [Actinotalea sp. K2]